jgi:hypothetical protein
MLVLDAIQRNQSITYSPELQKNPIYMLMKKIY